MPAFAFPAAAMVPIYRPRRDGRLSSRALCYDVKARRDDDDAGLTDIFHGQLV